MEKEKIRTTALKLFTEKGVESTGIKEIAEYSNVSEDEIKEHFSTKKELVADLYAVGKSGMLKFVYGELVEIEDFKELMHKVFYQSIIWGINNEDMFYFMNYIQQHPYQWGDEEKIYPTTNEGIRRRSEEAMKKGVIKQLPLDFVVHFMSGMHASCVSYILSIGAVTEDEYLQLMEPMFDTCWGALKNDNND